MDKYGSLINPPAEILFGLQLLKACHTNSNGLAGLVGRYSKTKALQNLSAIACAVFQLFLSKSELEKSPGGTTR